MKRLLGAAALGGGIALAAWAAVDPAVLPDAGPLREATVHRLLLLDGARVGARLVAVGDRGYIVLSDDGGAHWRRARAPAAPLLTAVTFLDARTGFAVGHDSVILATTDGGETWTERFSAPKEERPLMDVLFLTPREGIAIGAYGAYYETADGGRTWQARKITPQDWHLNAIARTAGDRLVIVGEAGTVLASDDAGRTWAPLASPYKGSLFGVVAGESGTLVAFGLRGHVYRSTDAGRTWTAVDNDSTATLMGGSRLPDGTLVLAGAAGRVLVSRDDGASFVPLPTHTPRAWATAVTAGPGAVLLLGETGAREVALPSRRRAPAG